VKSISAKLAVVLCVSVSSYSCSDENVVHLRPHAAYPYCQVY